MPITQFEYLTHTFKQKYDMWGTKSDFPETELSDFLNEKGKDGWELVSSTVNWDLYNRPSELLLIFKRPK
jgi:hypothetical protein